MDNIAYSLYVYGSTCTGSSRNREGDIQHDDDDASTTPPFILRAIKTLP